MRMVDGAHVLRLLAVLGSSAIALDQLSPAQSTEMFRNNLDHSGVYADSGSGLYGGVLWRKQTGGAVRSSPTISGGVVFVGSSDGNLYALDANTGPAAR